MGQAKKAAIYIRVSTVGQAEDGISLEAQQARAEAWVVARGAELVGVFRDAGISGGKMRNRPELKKAIETACRQRAALVVYSLSRLARSTRDALEISERLDRSGADLVSLSEEIDTTSAAGRMVFRMLAVLAEFERDLVSERTRLALSHLRKQGRKLGGRVPYGYDVDGAGYLRENEGEQRIIELMLHQRACGASFPKIAESLNSQGICTKLGKAWYPMTVSKVLKRAVI